MTVGMTLAAGAKRPGARHTAAARVTTPALLLAAALLSQSLPAAETPLPSGAETAAAVPAGASERLIFGDWIVYRDLAVSEDTPVSGDEIEALLGARARYGAQLAEFAGTRCRAPVYDLYMETPELLRRQVRLRFADLELAGDSVLAVDINCRDHRVEFDAGDTVYVVSRERLIAVVKGVYFELRPAPVQPQPQPASAR